jgi:CBS domain-containing protein
MEIELIEIRDFLARCPPFDMLPEERLNLLPKSVEIRYLRRERAFPPTDAEGAYLYLVRSGAIDLLDDEGDLVEKLDAGGVYIVPCQLLDLGRATRGVAVEDSLLYLLPCQILQDLRSAEPEFDRHFSESMRERLSQALAQVQVAGDPLGMAQMTLEV